MGRKMMNREEFRYHVSGPICSINTPFCRDGSIDFDGLRNFVDHAITGGARTVLCTPGDSLYVSLTDHEVAEITKMLAEYIGDRAVFLAAADLWWRGKAVEFAKYAWEVGADAMLVTPPLRGAPAVRGLADYYAAVAEYIPVFLLTGSLAEIGTDVSLEVMRVLLDEVPNVVGFKEDYDYEFARKACLLGYGRWAIFAGGLKQTHMNMHPYGCDGYMSHSVVVRPSVARTYWNAIEANDLTKATSIIRDYDMPLFDYLTSLSVGPDGGEHAVLELAGICGRWRRDPMPDLTDEEMEKLADYLKSESIL